MRKIDSHQHVFWHGRDDKALVADMDEGGIEYAWLLSWEIHPAENAVSYHPVLNPKHMRPDGTHAGIPLEDLILAKERHPDRFVLGFCPHPLMGDASARLKAAAQIFGVAVCGEWKFRIPFDDPRCICLFRTAGELGIPVVLHLDIPFVPDGAGSQNYVPHWYGGTVENLERALTACPETRFIGHAPGFWREISADAQTEQYAAGPVKVPGRVHQLFERHTNLYADLSANSGFNALSRDLEHAKGFLNMYAKRLLFARDYYGHKLAELLDSLDLPDDVRSDIYYKNAERLVAKPS